MSGFIRSKGNCPVCSGERKDCRELESNDVTLYFCRTDNPRPDFELKNHDIHGFGIYIEQAVLEEQAQEQREEWIRQRQAETETRLKAEKERHTQSLSEVERDREIRKLLAQLPLLPHHRQDLKRRELTDEQIDQGMFRSVEQWQKLTEPVSHRLAGVNINGRSLITQSGYICPIFNGSELIIGWQLRSDNAADGGKYKWPTSRIKNRPDGPTAHLQNGELPLTIHTTPGDRNLRLVEGILKPYVAHCRRGLSFIGAAGGNFASSPMQLKQYKDTLQPEKIILTPDAGARANKNVLRQYQAIAKLLKSWGLTLWVEDWGQSDDKSGCDVDELDSSEICTTIIPFSEWDVDTSKPRTTNPIEIYPRRLQHKAEKLKRWWKQQRKFTPTITQNQKYSQFPIIEDGSIFQGKGGTGTGKTYQMEQLFKPPVVDKKAGIYEEGGQFYHDGAIALGARNGLLLQNSKRLGFNHLQNEKCFHLLHEPKSKISFCSNSIIHILDPKWFDGKVLVLDEIMELLQHLLHSKTHKKDRAQCLKLWSECLKRAKNIILLDANLADWAVDEYIINLAGYRKVIKLENQYKGDRAPVEFLIGTSNKKSQLPENVNKELKEKGLNSRDVSPFISMIFSAKTPIIFADSQKQAEAIDYILTNVCGKKGLRIDSKTIAEKGSDADKFMAEPNKVIKYLLPQFVICSPSVQSGVDINITDYFSDSYGLFCGVVGTNTQLQMMGRLRDPNVKWHIACPEYTRKDNESFGGSFTKKIIEALKEYLLQDTAIITKNLPQLFDLIKSMVENLKDDPHHNAWAKLKAIENYEKANLRDCLIEVLTEAGHEIKFVELQHDDDGAELLKEAKETVLRKESVEIFNAPDIDPDKIQELQASFDATWEDRCQIIKAGYKDRLPGIENSKLWSQELIYLFRENRDFISQSELHYFLHNPHHLKEQQQELWSYIALGGLKFLPDIRSRHLKIKALEKLGIKDLLESDKFFNSKSPEILEILKLARRSKKLSAALGIVPGKDAIKYLRKLLDLIGFSLEYKKSNGDRSYRVIPIKAIKNVDVDIPQVRDILGQCLNRKYNPEVTYQEQKSSKWQEAQLIFNELDIKTAETIDISGFDTRADQPNNLINLGESALQKSEDTELQISDIIPPPDINRGDITPYLEDVADLVDCLEMIVEILDIPDGAATPLENFINNIQYWGWDVFKEGCKYSKAIRDKILYYASQLVASGKWEFVPAF